MSNDAITMTDLVVTAGGGTLTGVLPTQVVTPPTAVFGVSATTDHNAEAFLAWLLDAYFSAQAAEVDDSDDWIVRRNISGNPTAGGDMCISYVVKFPVPTDDLISSDHISAVSGPEA